MTRAELGETATGAAVLLAAAGFLIYALGAADAAVGSRGYELSARFGQAGGLAPGADVRVAGVKVGSVAGVELDSQTYLARARLQIDPAVKLPADSTARISADGLLGGSHVAIEPGAAAESLVNGGEITNTQGAVDLFGLIGRAIRPAPPVGGEPGA